MKPRNQEKLIRYFVQNIYDLKNVGAVLKLVDRVRLPEAPGKKCTIVIIISILRISQRQLETSFNQPINQTAAQ